MPLELSMENFSFQFDDQKKLLNQISVQIHAGNKVSVSGEEGSGKSLFIRMLTGNYQDFQGNLLVNHIPIQNYDLKSLRKQTGILLHGQEIFGGTVWENISLGQEDMSPESIMTTAKKLGFEDFIKHFPYGFDSLLEPIGKKTPQTIIRKILLLRALTGEKKLLLLEEPWNGLDEKSKQTLQAYLLSKDLVATCVIVSSDQAFNVKTDQQIIFKNGTI